LIRVKKSTTLSSKKDIVFGIAEVPHQYLIEPKTKMILYGHTEGPVFFIQQFIALV